MHQCSINISICKLKEARNQPLSFTTGTRKPCECASRHVTISHVILCRYVSAQKDRVTVIFSTIFMDDDDVVIGKVFMQVRPSMYIRTYVHIHVHTYIYMYMYMFLYVHVHTCVMCIYFLYYVNVCFISLCCFIYSFIQFLLSLHFLVCL